MWKRHVRARSARCAVIIMRAEQGVMPISWLFWKVSEIHIFIMAVGVGTHAHLSHGTPGHNR